MKKTFVKPEMKCHKLRADKVLVGSGGVCAVYDSGGGIGDCIAFCEAETCSSDHPCVDHPVCAYYECEDHPDCVIFN